MQREPIEVRASWDPEAGVFVATSDDVPGLVAEAATMDDLMCKLAILVPELLELNCPSHGDYRDVPLKLLSERVAMVRIRA